MKKMNWLWVLVGVLFLSVLCLLALVANLLVQDEARQNENLNTLVNNTFNENSSLNTNAATNTNSSQPEVEKYSLLASMQGLGSGLGFMGDRDLEALAQGSWLTLLESSSFETYLANQKKQLASNAALLKKGPFSSNRDVVAEFVWNVVEPREGEFDWTLPDAAMQAAGEGQVTVSAVVQPFSSWNSTETVPAEKCVGIDFVFMDYKAGLPLDMGKYESFLEALVERYDGDGQDDMPGLTTRVSAWEIGNEYEGPCSGNLNQPENYLTVLKASYALVKQADPTALVLNAGALETIGGDGEEITATIDFWNTFFEQGGADYLDIFNFHYNRERNEKRTDLSIWQKNLNYYRTLLDESSHEDMPMWITEYGTFGGSIQAPIQPNGQPGATLTRTDEEQASWYFRTMITGMAAGIQRFFFDLKGADGGGIGSSAWYDFLSKPRAFTTTVVGIAEALQGANTAEQLGEGQYKFTTQDTVVYALWEGELPTDITGVVTVMALDGSVDTQEASTLSFSEAEPVLVIIHATQ